MSNRDHMMEQIRELEDPIYDKINDHYDKPKMQTHIAGIPHRKPDLSLLSVGSTVSLVHEPTNKYDPNAIMVIANSVQLGYIPKGDTGLWKHLTSAKIVEITPERKWSEVIIEGEEV